MMVLGSQKNSLRIVCVCEVLEEGSLLEEILGSVETENCGGSGGRKTMRKECYKNQ